jgi:hypothetical protein
MRIAPKADPSDGKFDVSNMQPLAADKLLVQSVAIDSFFSFVSVFSLPLMVMLSLTVTGSQHVRINTIATAARFESLFSLRGLADDGWSPGAGAHNEQLQVVRLSQELPAPVCRNSHRVERSHHAQVCAS